MEEDLGKPRFSNPEKGAGVKIALVNCGTGYSNLYHIQAIRLDRVRIGRRFRKWPIVGYGIYLSTARYIQQIAAEAARTAVVRTYPLVGRQFDYGMGNAASIAISLV